MFLLTKTFHVLSYSSTFIGPVAPLDYPQGTHPCINGKEYESLSTRFPAEWLQSHKELDLE